jgi:hypothetical protein
MQLPVISFLRRYPSHKMLWEGHDFNRATRGRESYHETSYYYVMHKLRSRLHGFPICYTVRQHDVKACT